MALDFPASPTEGQVFSPAGGPQYIYHAPVWHAVSTAVTGVPEAPGGGVLYGRKDVAWAAINGASVPFTPAGSIAAATVQGALAELDTEKLALSGGTLTGQVVQSPLGFMPAFKEEIITQTPSGFYVCMSASAANGWPAGSSSYWHLLSSSWADTQNYAMQFACSLLDQNLYFRSTGTVGTRPWQLVHHSGNNNPLQLSGGTISGALTVTGQFTASAVGLLDTGLNHRRNLICGEDLTGDRGLTFVGGDTNRVITLTGNPTLNDWFNQGVKTTDSPTFSALTLTNLTISGGITGNLFVTSQVECGSLALRDTTGGQTLNLTCFENLTASRALQIVPGDANRVLTFTGNPTLGDWFNQSVRTTGTPTFAGMTLTGDVVGNVSVTNQVACNILALRDTAGGQTINISCLGDMPASRALQIDVSDANRVMTFTGNPTLADWFDQSVKSTVKPSFAGITATAACTLTSFAASALSTVAGLTLPTGNLAITVGQFNCAGAVVSPYIYNNTVTGTTAGVQVTSSGILNRTTGSSIAIKKDIEPMWDDVGAKVLQLNPVFHRFKIVTDAPDWSWYGLIAEEVAALDERFAGWDYAPVYDEAGHIVTEPIIDEETKAVVSETGGKAVVGTEKTPVGINWPAITAALIDQVQQQAARIAALETRLQTAGIT